MWSISETDKGKSQFKLIHTLTGHRFGILSVKFSPCSEYLVSLGDSNERRIIVWDIKNTREPMVSTPKAGRKSADHHQMIASKKVTGVINCIAFAPQKKYMVTAGYSHLVFWNMVDTFE